MNSRQNIADNLEKMKIDLDTPFRFHCTMCGKCCINRDDILLNPDDIFRIAKFLNLTPEEVVNQYCETYIGGTSRMPIVRLKPQGTVKRCPFLKDRKCSIQDAKPVVCAMFPIGRYVRVPKDQVMEESIPETLYLFSAPECGDTSESHTVREWLANYNIPIQDPFFSHWQHTLLSVSEYIQRVEAICPQPIMETVWSLVFRSLYLEYDMTGNFMPQFLDNSELVLSVMKKLSSGVKE